MQNLVDELRQPRTRRSGDRIDASDPAAAMRGGLCEEVGTGIGADIVRLARLATSIHLAESVHSDVFATLAVTGESAGGFATAEQVQ